MKIKNITQFRTYFKEKVRETSDSNRNEHFVGTKSKKDNGKSTYGFFDLYHGHKDKGQTKGIRGFLEGFLDMAKDAQAVYEFLQNAVDAGSSHFAMFWEKDEESNEEYLLVINNGIQFDFAAVESILNVGVSTKKPEEHTIGKFGIGFKLAHRLVGKENGLDELIDKNYGPILFSWKQGEVYDFPNNPNKLIPTQQNYELIEDESNGEHHFCKTDDAWLFKILITNFPTQPNEEIRDVHYEKTTNAFSTQEVETLHKWLQKYLNQLPEKEYNEGSLFFIKLGEGKKEHLEDADLETGVKFSLSILNHVRQLSNEGLKKVTLNNSEIESVDLKYLNFIVEKESNEYKKIRFNKTGELNDSEHKIMNDDEDIEFLMGYANYGEADAQFKNAPNFYLFFPLSEEKHELKFILHCNAFYKASHRTSLHKGTEDSWGINERLFDVFGKKLIAKLKELEKSENPADRQQYLDIYANLLLSEKSANNDRKWVNQPLIEPIFEYLKNNIPVHIDNSFFISQDSASVRIKDTKLPFSPSSWGLSFNWFYWSDDLFLSREAVVKNSIKRFNIIDLLKVDDVYGKINVLLASNPKLNLSILGEINANITQPEFESIKVNLFNLKLFTFKGNSNESDVRYSIQELSKKDLQESYLLNYKIIAPIKELLERVGFKISEENLSIYNNLYERVRYSAKINYVNKHETVPEVLNKRLIRNKFTSIEKNEKILPAIEQIGENSTKAERNSRMRTLKLFSNEMNEVVSLGSLLTQTTITWLKPFRIKKEEYDEKLDRYLVFEDKEIYTNIIYPLWEKIIQNTSLITENSQSFYKKVIDFYNKSSSLDKYLLTNKSVILSNGRFYASSDKTFYSRDLQDISQANYSILSSLFDRIFGLQLPDYEIIEFLNETPFKVISTNYDVLLSEEIEEISKEEATALIEFASVCNWKFFDKYVLSESAVGSTVISPKETYTQIWVGKDEILANYIKKYYTEYVVCPYYLEKAKELIGNKYKDSKLVKHLIDLLQICSVTTSEKYRTQKRELINILIIKDDLIIKYYFSKLKMLSLSTITWNSFDELADRVRLALKLQNVEEVKDDFTSHLQISAESLESSFILSQQVGLGVDTIYFGEHDEYSLKVSDIFTETHTQISGVVNSIIEKFKGRGLTEELKLNTLFGLSKDINKIKVLNMFDKSKNNVIVLDNAAQLGFMLLYSKFTNSDYDLEKKCGVEAQNSNVYFLQDFGISNEHFSFFEEKDYINFNRYGKIIDYLSLGIDKPVFNASKVSLFFYPTIENNRLTGPSFKIPKTDAERIKFLTQILTIYNNEEKVASPESVKDWYHLLKFNPTTTIIHKFKSPHESLPQYIENWRTNNPNNEEKKNSLLKAIECNFESSRICRLRKSLIEGKSEITLAEIASIPSVLLIGTLNLLSSSGYNFSFQADSENDKLIKKVIEALFDKEKTEVPLPIWNNEHNRYEIKNLKGKGFYYWDGEASNKLYEYGMDYNTFVQKVSNAVYSSTLFYKSDKLKRYCLKVKPEEKINRNRIEENVIEEWNEKFYLKWKEEYDNCSIYRVSHVSYDVFVYDDKIAEINKEEHYYNFTTKKLYVPVGFTIEKVLQLIREQRYFSNAGIKLNEEYQKHRKRIQEYLDNDSLYDNDLYKEKREKLKKELEKELEKVEHKEKLETTEKYSYGWFKSFLNILCLQGEGDSKHAELEIAFMSGEKDTESEKLIVLKDPNRTVTPTIEYCTDFKANFYQKKYSTPTKIKIGGVSKKGQRVIAYTTELEKLSKIDFNDIKRIELKFSRIVDLLNRLRKSFERLGSINRWADDVNLKEHLTENIDFIFGPPGTGKTTTIAKSIREKMNSSSENLKVLVLTPTNKAADVLAEKIIQQSFDEKTDKEWLIRYGATFSNTVLEEEHLYDANNFDIDLYPTCTLITTIHRFPYEEVIEKSYGNVNNKKRLCDVKWDYVIFDEASMIPLPYIIFSIYQSYSIFNNTQYIIGGDPFQIPPVVVIKDEDLPDEFVKDENIYQMIGLQTFIESEQKNIPVYGDKIQNLGTQYRSIELIGKLFSHFRYNSLLKHGREILPNLSPKSRELPTKFKDLGITPLSLIRFPVNSEDSVYHPKKLNSSPYHTYSALLVYELVKYFYDSIRDKQEKWSVGIVCPYRSQATLMNKMIESLSLPSFLEITTDTVHGFQGDDCDIVFFLISPTNTKVHSGQFLNRKYLINVAISRAKDYLVVLYPEHGTGVESTSNIVSLENIIKNELGLRLNDITIHSNQIEKRLFHNSKYIEENVFTNKHQLVNVYGKAEKAFMIKEAKNAIDIQLKSD